MMHGSILRVLDSISFIPNTPPGAELYHSLRVWI